MWEPRRETGKFHSGGGPRAEGTARRRDPGPPSPGAAIPGGPEDPERSRPAGRKTKEKRHVRGGKAEEGGRGERSLEFIFTFSPGAAGSGSLGGGAGAARPGPHPAAARCGSGGTRLPPLPSPPLPPAGVFFASRGREDNSWQSSHVRERKSNWHR